MGDVLTVQRQVDENNVHSGGNPRLIRHQQDGPKPSEAPPCLEISDPSPVSSGDRLQVRRGEQVGEGLKKKKIRNSGMGVSTAPASRRSAPIYLTDSGSVVAF